jgi:hypothetical protein
MVNMDTLLTNPVVQSAVVPFAVSLIVAIILRPHGWYWAGLAALAGFAASIYLITGFELFPLRADRKIVLIGCGAAVLGLLLDLLPWRRLVPALLFIAGIAAAVWLLWPRLNADEAWQFLLLAGGGVLYAGWLVAASEGLKDKPLQADSVVFALGLGTGLTALLGATALYGQLGSAIAAAVGARLLLQLLGKPVAAGAVMVVPLVTVAALLGVGAMVYSKLPWYTLALLALVPLLARLPLPSRWPMFLQVVLSVVVTGLPAAAAIYLTWRELGAPPI